jgi:hypothetical protein
MEDSRWQKAVEMRSGKGSVQQIVIFLKVNGAACRLKGVLSVEDGR